MIADRPTPESDAAVVSAEYIRREMDYYKHKFILADHARRLERQRDAAVEALKAYERAGVGNSTDHELQIKAWAMANAVLREIEGES